MTDPLRAAIYSRSAWPATARVDSVRMYVHKMKGFFTPQPMRSDPPPAMVTLRDHIIRVVNTARLRHQRHRAMPLIYRQPWEQRHEHPRNYHQTDTRPRR
jgi:hypothetical protein